MGSKGAYRFVVLVPESSLCCIDLRPLLTSTSSPNMAPTTRHRTQDKNALINMIHSMGTCIYFYGENPPILLQYANNRDKRKHSHSLSSHCVSYTTHQGPRVSGDTSGNLILCCKPQICCLARRAAPPAPHILVEMKVDFSFSRQGGPSNGRLCGLRLV